MNCVKLLILSASFFVAVAAAADSEVDLKGTPEENATLAVRDLEHPNARYILVKKYLSDGQLDAALRASKQIIVLAPDDAKANGMLAYVEAKAGLDEAAILHARKAYLTGYDDSIVLLSVLLYKQGTDVGRNEVATYLPKLDELKAKNIDAWQPLLAVGIGLPSLEKKAFEVKYLANVDLSRLVRDKTIKNMLLIFYRSANDEQKIKEINSLGDGAK